MIDWLAREKCLRQLRREFEALKAEVLQLRAQNESMRAGMRRCITCDYRLEAKNGRGRDGDALAERFGLEKE